MYFKFPCQNCGKKLKVDEEHANRKARCPYCKTSQVIPEPPGDDADPAAMDPAEHESGSGELLSDLDALAPRLDEPTTTQVHDPPQAAPRMERQTSDGDISASSPRSARRARDKDDSKTDVSIWQSGLIGIGFTLALYALLYPVRESVGVLFYGRGWVPVVITLLMGWALGVLGLKYLKLRRQRDSMLFDVLPTEIGRDINTRNIGRFIAHVRDLPMDASRSFLISRVQRGLEHFRVRRSIVEVAEMHQSQSEIDRNAVTSSYSLLNVFLWAIPILGFIGTVLGISIAVAGFSGTMGEAEEIAVMRDSLEHVMSGLGTAFDTTLLALCMAVLLIFPMKFMQKAEEDLLDWVDEYTNENLLKRLQDAGGGSGSEHEKQILKTIDNAMANHHAELRAWAQKLETIGQTFRQKASEEWSQMHGQLIKEHEQREKAFTESTSNLTKKQKELLTQMAAVQEQLAQLQQEQAGQVTSAQTEMADSIKSAAESLNTYVNGMQAGLDSLNHTLGQLNGKTVTINAPRRGWLFGRK